MIHRTTPEIHLHRLRLSSFRSYAQANVSFADGLNVLLGANGAGKTNLLEAIAYLALGRSPRVARDVDLVRRGAVEFELEAHFGVGPRGSETESNSSLAVHYRPADGRAVEIDGVAGHSIRDLYGRLLVVFFSPDDLWLIKGAPALRRMLLDRVLVQASPLYADSLLRYRQALAQRNAALREVRGGRAGRALLEIWEPQLVQYGAEIMQRRAELVGSLSEFAASAYRAVTRAREALECRYLPSLGESHGNAPDEHNASAWHARLEAALSRRLRDDLAAGATSVGPHRDDLETTVQGGIARRFASQGQQRSAVLALKFAERSHLARHTGRIPLLLVDDVLSELDAARRDALLELLGEEGQVFITTADETRALALRGAALFNVGPGTVTAAGRCA